MASVQLGNVLRQIQRLYSGGSAAGLTDAARFRSRESRGIQMDAIAGRDSATADRRNSELHAEIAQLPEPLRRALVLCDLEGMTQLEAARKLGCGEATRRRRLAGAHERLKRRLDRSGLAGAVSPLGALLVKLNPVPAAWIDAVARTAAAEAAGQTLMSTAGRLAAVVLGAMTPPGT